MVVGRLQHHAWTAEAGIAPSVVEVVADRAGAKPAVGHGDHDQGDVQPGTVAGSTSEATKRGRGRSMLAFRSVVSVLVRSVSFSG